MTGTSYPEIRRAGVGVLLNVGLGADGVIARGALFALHELGSTSSTPEVQVIKIDLHTNQCRPSAVFPAFGPLHSALGALWLVSGKSLVELSTRNLTVMRRIPVGQLSSDFAEVDGGIWMIWNGQVEVLWPGRSRFVQVSLPWLARDQVDSLAADGSTLYLTSVASTRAASISSYNPRSGTHRQTIQPEAGDYFLVGATGKLLWVTPPGGMFHSVQPYSAATLNLLPGKFAGGGPNGTWSAAAAGGVLLFENVGRPLDCVSGVTGLLAAKLEVHGQIEASDATNAESPAFLGAGDGVLAVAAKAIVGDQPDDRGVALYKLDPHCS